MNAADTFGYKHQKNRLSKRPVIKGDFSSRKINYKEPGIYKLNRTASLFLILFVILSIISYFCVLLRANVIKELHTETNKISYENIELQNKVDVLKSFYSIDTKVSKIDFLKKPDKVIEVSEGNVIIQKSNGNIDRHKLKQVPAGF